MQYDFVSKQGFRLMRHFRRRGNLKAAEEGLEVIEHGGRAGSANGYLPLSRSIEDFAHECTKDVLKSMEAIHGTEYICTLTYDLG